MNGLGVASPRAKPERVRRKVVYLAIHLRSCRKVADVFNRWNAGAAVGKTWVAQVMKEHAGEIVQLRLEMRRPPGGPTFSVLGVIDQGS
jgi:hypothetical protein